MDKTTDTTLSRNTLSFIGLAREYCEAMDNVADNQRLAFIDTMLRLLPRLYITITSHPADNEIGTDVIGSFIDERHYTQIRNAVAALMGEDDTYLETFEEDMKYSDTPIAASVSEALADIYQDIYNFLMTVRDSEGTLAPLAMDQMRENFALYWSKTLCNVMRPLNALKYN